MSSSCIKYPASGSPGPSTPLIAFSVHNFVGFISDIDSIQVINGVDDPLIVLVPATGYESTFPIQSVGGTGSPHYGKAVIDITNPPTAIRIFYTSNTPGTPYTILVTVLGNTVTTASDFQSSGGSYSFDVPVDFALGSPAHLIFKD